MRYWKFLALPALISFAEHPELCTGPGIHQYRSSAGVPVRLLRLRPVQLCPIRVLRV